MRAVQLTLMMSLLAIPAFLVPRAQAQTEVDIWEDDGWPEINANYHHTWKYHATNNHTEPITQIILEEIYSRLNPPVAGPMPEGWAFAQTGTAPSFTITLTAQGPEYWILPGTTNEEPFTFTTFADQQETIGTRNGAAIFEQGGSSADDFVGSRLPEVNIWEVDGHPVVFPDCIHWKYDAKNNMTMGEVNQIRFLNLFSTQPPVVDQQSIDSGGWIVNSITEVSPSYWNVTIAQDWGLPIYPGETLGSTVGQVIIFTFMPSNADPIIGIKYGQGLLMPGGWAPLDGDPFIGAIGIYGDMNCDNVLDANDIPWFIDALLDPGNYTGCDVNRADMNRDGAIDGLDIALFVNCLAQ